MQRRASVTSDDSLVHVDAIEDSGMLEPRSLGSEQASPSSSTMADAASTSAPSGKAKLLYCKSHVAIHPTQFNKDNIPGYLGIVEADGNDVQTDSEGKVTQGSGKHLLVTWVPNELLQRMDAEDREGYKRVEDRANGSGSVSDLEEDGFVFVTVPPPKGEKYAFSIPLSSIYSILIYPPSLQHWYGSATFNLNGGVSLPTLFFHDDESPMLSRTARAGTQPSRVPRAQWGFTPFLALLQSHATVLRSRLLSSKAYDNAELFLINPSKADREVHEAGIEGESSEKTESSTPYPPQPGFPDANVLAQQPNPKQAILTGLSNITNFSRRMSKQVSKQILAHPLAQEVVPHLPPAFRSFVNAPGEWDRPGRERGKDGKADVANEFESARLYLARWARVVAEEGERARRNEVAGRAGIGSDSQSDVDDLASSLGVFSLLSSPNSKRPVPHPTRDPTNPITCQDWKSFAEQGRDELFVRREIFKRGFSNSTEPAAKATRREGWEVLLGIIPWSVGGLGGGEEAMAKRRTAREAAREKKRAEYATLRAAWKDDAALKERDGYKEEWHRIDVDCRRTDRSQPMFAIPSESPKPKETKDGSESSPYDSELEHEGEEGGAARLNPHIAALRTILMTYHNYRPELGYVQGMSDLLAPIYVVFDANEADAFWGLVGVMKEMESNFLRDQSGMKRQLSTLQQLIGVMDPELYAHLERTGSLNLFFCFRWILIAFKREFKFEDVIRLWEILWTDYYSDQFVLFVALAVLQSHREVIIRYLTEFDEVLKYANDLSGTIDLDTTLAQAEVLFIQYRGMVDDFDQEKAAEDAVDGGLRKRRGSAPPSTETDEAKTKPREISPELRDLLKSFKLNEA